jgi:membrane protein DedA with SNARE-associated domain
MFHDVIRAWFEWSEQMGYFGVFALMALESTIVPIPSEIVMPPAGFHAAQGRMSMPLVVLAGGAGSTFGSSLCYWLTYTLGRAFVVRWGKWFLFGPDKLELAEKWLSAYALPGVFFARLLPVVRHLIGFPAGLVRVPFGKFAVVTFVGSTLWCWILAEFGARTLGRRPDLLTDPNALVDVMKHDLRWFVLAIVALGAAFLFVKLWGRRAKA